MIGRGGSERVDHSVEGALASRAGAAHGGSSRQTAEVMPTEWVRS